MDTKNITIDVDAETSKAKRKITELSASGGAGGASGDGASAVSNASQKAARNLEKAAASAASFGEAARRGSSNLGQTARTSGGAGGASSDGASAVSNASQKAARNLEKAAAGANSLSESAKRGSAQLVQIGKIMGGIAVRMAASYAANRLEEGSAARHAVNSAGNVAAGALQGSVAGPLGAAAGALMGAAQSIMEIVMENDAKKAEIDNFNRDFKISEQDYQSGKMWKEKLDALTEVEEGFSDFAGRIAEINALLAKYQDVEKVLIGKVNDFAASGDLESANIERRYLASNRSRQEQLKTAAKAMEGRENLYKKQEAGKIRSYAESYSAPDAISRIGGSMGGGDYARQQVEYAKQNADSAKETVILLKSIDQKTKGGAIWQ